MPRSCLASVVCSAREVFLLSMRTPHEPEASVECACEEETSSALHIAEQRRENALFLL